MSCRFFFPAALAAHVEWSLMLKLSGLILVVVVVLLAAGAVFLGTWPLPAPTAKVERVIPNDRFPR